MSNKRKTSFDIKLFIFSCLEHRRRQIGMWKWSYCLILHRNTGTWAIVLHSVDKKIWLQYSTFWPTRPLDFFRTPLFSSGPGVILTPLPLVSVELLVMFIRVETTLRWGSGGLNWPCSFSWNYTGSFKTVLTIFINDCSQLLVFSPTIPWHVSKVCRKLLLSISQNIQLTRAPTSPFFVLDLSLATLLPVSVTAERDIATEDLNSYKIVWIIVQT